MTRSKSREEKESISSRVVAEVKKTQLRKTQSKSSKGKRSVGLIKDKEGHVALQEDSYSDIEIK